MAEATAILSPNRETQRMLRHRSAVMTLARMRAKKSVLLTLRAQGFTPQHFSVREIFVLTDYYLNQHRARLIAEAAEATTWPGFAQWHLPPEQGVFVNSQKLNTCQTRTAQSQEKSLTASVAPVTANRTLRRL